MTASRRTPREQDSIASWVGPGVFIPGPTDVEIVIAPRLHRQLRRLVVAASGLERTERAEIVRAIERTIRARFGAARSKLTPNERARLDALLRKAGLPRLP
jgi:hypothetical protein